MEYCISLLVKISIVAAWCCKNCKARKTVLCQGLGTWTHCKVSSCAQSNDFINILVQAREEGNGKSDAPCSSIQIWGHAQQIACRQQLQNDSASFSHQTSHTQNSNHFLGIPHVLPHSPFGDEKGQTSGYQRVLWVPNIQQSHLRTYQSLPGEPIFSLHFANGHTTLATYSFPLCFLFLGGLWDAD